MKLRAFLISILFTAALFSGNPKSFQFGNIQVTAPAADSLIITQIMQKFELDILEFQRKIGQYPDLPVKVIVAEDDDEYMAYARSSSDIIEFSRAFYSRRENTIYLHNIREHRNFVYLNQILLHEYIHSFVAHYLKGPPLWFNEGMAVYFSNDLSINREFNFIRNYILGNSRNLEQMKYRYPENRIEWESFYAKAGLAVKYLYKKRKNQFYRFWEKASYKNNFNQIFMNSFFMTPYDYSVYFEEYSKKHFTTEILLASTGLIWGILPLILIIGWIRKKIINHRIRVKWETEEEIITVISDNDEETELSEGI